MLYSWTTPQSVQYSIRAEVVREEDLVVVGHAQRLRIVGGHEDIAATCPEQEVDLPMDHRVELLPAARAEQELSGRDVRVGQVDDREARSSVRHRERPALAESGTAVLE